ncbi:YfhO family protein [Patescibacteria group bacterium]|nr:YfhO family protein [Patescibacteria group bacterium]
MNVRRLTRFFWFWPVAGILAVWALFALPWWFHGLVPFPSRYLMNFFPPWSAMGGMAVKNNAMPDVITQMFPWKVLTVMTWKIPEVPLWNPYSFSGTPQLANYQSAVLSPFNLLFMVLPMIDAWSVLVLLQPLLAGLFMFLFLRSSGVTRPASLLGGIAFMFSGFLTVWMAYGTLGYAVLWLPFILWSVRRSLDRGGWFPLLGVSFGVMMSFLSGHFQISLYVAAMSFAYLLWETIASKKYRQALYLTGFSFCGILLSLPQLLPATYAYLASVRSVLFGKGGEVIPWNYLVTLIAPDYYGNPVTRNDWFGHYAEWASYIGVIPLTFALYEAVNRLKDKRIWFFLVSCVVTLLLATKTPLSAFLFWSKVPVIATSAASRIIVLFSFSLAVVGAFGIDALCSDWRDRRIKNLLKAAVPIVIALVLLWTVTLRHMGLPSEWAGVAVRNLILPTGVLSVGLIAAGAGFFLRGINVRKTLLFVLIGLSAFEMLRYAGKWMPFDPKEYVYPPTAVGTFLSNASGVNRVFGNIYNEFTGTNRLQSIVGYDAVYQERYGEFISTAVNGTIRAPERSLVQFPKDGAYSEKILGFLGAKYLVHRISDGRYGWTYPYWKYPNYVKVFEDAYYQVFENTHAFPRSFLVSGYRVESGRQQIIDTMFAPDFSLRDAAVLETEPEVPPAKGDGNVTVTSYLPDRVELRTDAQANKLLVLTDTYDAGWRAYVDGHEAPVYRADYDFRAVAVPEGKHTVTFVYDPASFRFGSMIAMGVLVFLAGGTVVYVAQRPYGRRRKRI